MKTYTVLYRESDQCKLDPLSVFKCKADDEYHAWELCDDISPDCDVIWVREGDCMKELFNALRYING